MREVQQEARSDSLQSHVGKNLLLMDISDARDALHLNDDFILDQQVDPERAVEGETLVTDGHRNFSIDMQMVQSQVVREASLVGGFQKSRPKGPVHFDRRPNYPIGQVGKIPRSPFYDRASFMPLHVPLQVLHEMIFPALLGANDAIRSATVQNRDGPDVILRSHEEPPRYVADAL